MSRRQRLISVAGATLLLFALTAGSAAAKPIERGHFDDNTSRVIEGFCGDLTVREDTDVSVNFIFNPQGPDGIPHYMETVSGSVTWTNLANGKSFEQVFHTVSRDLKVTDNGDGTLTILVLATGGGKVYGPDGKLLFKDDGQVRFAFLVDHGGTPSDPSDDVFLEDLGLVKESTGTNDLQGRDFCDDIHEFIG